MKAHRFSVSLASASDREAIYRLRHSVYASELHQHSENSEGRLVDRLDSVNAYLVVKVGDDIVGHVSVTPPGDHGYSLEKYIPREDLPFPLGPGSFEVRLLTVRDDYRGGPAAVLLLLGALRWIRALGGTRVIAIGRKQVLPFYRKAGLIPAGIRIKSGAVEYELMTATTAQLTRVEKRRPLFARVARQANWRLEAPGGPAGLATGPEVGRRILGARGGTTP